jgi:hypothetical protein
LADKRESERFEVIPLNTTRVLCSFPRQSTHQTTLRIAVAILAAVVSFSTAQCVIAQTPLATTSPTNIADASLFLNLLDSPGYLGSSSTRANVTDEDPENPNDQQTASNLNQQSTVRTRHIGRLSMTIAPNEIAEPMSVNTKVVAGLKNSVSLFSLTGWIASAGWAQLTNGSPNYGTDRGAFGQRLGAAAVRNISESIFTDSLFAPVFHEDSRYYIMGRGHNVFKRAVYAATRAVVTRTDSGHTTPNLALLAGNASGSALTVAYYPAKNTTFSEVAQTFGGSVGGSAIGFVVTEFLGDAVEFVHLKKRD